MIVIVFARKELFSSNILNLMLSQGLLKSVKTENNIVREIFDIYVDDKPLTNIKAIEVTNFLYLTEKDVLHLEKEFKEPCEFVIISPHKSKIQTVNSITIHHCGNFNKNEFGGEENNFSVVNLDAFKFLYNAISSDANKPKDLNFFVEATHHGPTLKRPVLFYEIGPNEQAYNNKEYQRYYLTKLLEYIKSEKKDDNLEPYILFGSSHYLDLNFINKIKTKMKEKHEISNIVLAHILPKYALKELLEQDDSKIELVFLNLMTAAKTKKVILNKKYLKSLGRITNILNKIKTEKKGVKYFRI